MNSEQTRLIEDNFRIKEAQDNLYKWCLNNLPVGRKTTQEDEEGIERIRESNLKARENLFGSKEYVWYLKEDLWKF